MKAFNSDMQNLNKALINVHNFGVEAEDGGASVARISKSTKLLAKRLMAVMKEVRLAKSVREITV